MASFTTDGVESLMIDLRSAIELPTTTKSAMLEAGAKVTMTAQQETMRSMGIYDTRQKYASPHLVSSIKQTKNYYKSDGFFTYVYPQGTRKRVRTTTRQGEIAFINEFGKKGQKARPAIKKANETCADDAAEAEFKVFDSYLKSKNL